MHIEDVVVVVESSHSTSLPILIKAEVVVRSVVAPIQAVAWVSPLLVDRNLMVRHRGEEGSHPVVLKIVRF